jgi:hypothetical protein
MKKNNPKLKIIFAAVVFMGVFWSDKISLANTLYVDDCSPLGVGAAHEAASDGDVIYLRCNTSGDEVIWTSDITITKHVTIQGK